MELLGIIHPQYGMQLVYNYYDYTVRNKIQCNYHSIHKNRFHAVPEKCVPKFGVKVSR